MKKIIAIPSAADPDKTEAGIVHYDGPEIIGSHTLCGHTDRVSWTFVETNKRVNCPGCIGTRDHVLGKL